MFIVKCPLRVSIFGGGTDYPGYYQNYGGKALSFALDKHIYLIVRDYFLHDEFNFHVSYKKIERVKNIYYRVVTRDPKK